MKKGKSMNIKKLVLSKFYQWTYDNFVENKEKYYDEFSINELNVFLPKFLTHLKTLPDDVQKKYFKHSHSKYFKFQFEEDIKLIDNFVDYSSEEMEQFSQELAKISFTNQITFNTHAEYSDYIANAGTTNPHIILKMLDRISTYQIKAGPFKTQLKKRFSELLGQMDCDRSGSGNFVFYKEIGDFIVTSRFTVGSRSAAQLNFYFGLSDKDVENPWWPSLLTRWQVERFSGINHFPGNIGLDLITEDNLEEVYTRIERHIKLFHEFVYYLQKEVSLISK